MQSPYNLPYVVHHGHIKEYIDFASEGNPTSLLWNPHNGKLLMWNKFRIQQHSSLRSPYITKCQVTVVQAYPRSPEKPFGACDVVRLARANTKNILDVARVKAVFSQRGSKELPPYLAPTSLLYVELFYVVSLPSDAQDGVGLYKVRRPPPPPAEGASRWFAVIPVTEVVHTLELIPVFDTRIPEVELSSATCLDAYYEYYVNSFTNKEMH
ncbi:hypothetical protein OG21DRAFT_812082 [Imleria badia]|nr:hypothetical protein OG21DRAFT_812082 [Imleria badia]